MNTPELMSGLFCDKRQHPLDCDFVLGYEEYLQTFDRQLLWPAGYSLISVLCSECSEVSEYSQEDVRTVYVPAWHPYARGSRYIWRIQARCGRGNCDFQKTVHYQSASSTKRDLWHRFAEKHTQLTFQDCGQQIPLTEIFDACTQRLGIV